MTVRVEKSGEIWTIIHSRPDARNAMDWAIGPVMQSAHNSRPM